MNVAVAVNLWARPRASEFKAGQYQNDQHNPAKPRLTLTGQMKRWTRPCRADREGVTGGSQRSSLRSDVRTWARPRASEGKGCGPLGSRVQQRMLKLSYLNAQVAEFSGHAGKDSSNTGGSLPGPLSADWDEVLMGLPIGWTALRPLGMGSFRSNWLRLSLNCLRCWMQDEHHEGD